MKIDGRCIGREVLDSIRADAMARIVAGEKVSAVMNSYGLCRTTAYKWMRKMQEQDVTTLLSAKPTGRPPRLNGKQKA